MIRPNHRKLERRVIKYAEESFRQSLTPESSERSFSYWSDEQDHVRNALLAELGYQRSDNFMSLNRMALTQKPPERLLPPGYAIRPFSGEAEIEARVAVHRAAFHPSKMTVEKHRKAMTLPTYRQELDLVCQAPDGALAAYTIVWFDETNRFGLFEPVGCHPDQQRKGLASAVMTEGLRRLYDLGARCAYVNAWRQDSPGARTYQALGFEMIGRLYQWKKEV
jgi:GNAT superfamily N-acetyltransferase